MTDSIPAAEARDAYLRGCKDWAKGYQLDDYPREYNATLANAWRSGWLDQRKQENQEGLDYDPH